MTLQFVNTSQLTREHCTSLDENVTRATVVLKGVYEFYWITDTQVDGGLRNQNAQIL